MAAATARSAARSRPTASVPCAGLLATPKLIVTGTAASAKVRWVARRRRSATMKAPRSSVSGSNSANSSPPMRAAWSMRRFHLRQSLATSWRAVSPAAWPWRSFTAANESRSPTITDSGRPARVARSSSMSSISSSARRFMSPVRESVRVRVRDAAAQSSDAPALMQGKDRQCEGAGVWDERSEGADRLHLPLSIDRSPPSLERVTPKIKRP